MKTYDAVVVGGGPAGATAAHKLAKLGRSVLLLDRPSALRLCGAVPPVLIDEFEIPAALVQVRLKAARMISPSGRLIDMPIEDGYVGMLDRPSFDEWLRDRAIAAGAIKCIGSFDCVTRADDGTAVVNYQIDPALAAAGARSVRARAVIGADGAISAVARQLIPSAKHSRQKLFYHEIVKATPTGPASYDPARCDIYHREAFSPDFYAWVFPHGATVSIGSGTGSKDFSLPDAVGALRRLAGFEGVETIKRERALVPASPLPRWDNGRDVVLAGDAAGLVAPASGEGIYYAMTSGRMAAEAVHEMLATGDARALAMMRTRFMKSHGRIFWVLGIMQRFWYSSDGRRERFLSLCRDPNIQRSSLDAYLNKELGPAKRQAHELFFFRNLALDALGYDLASRSRPRNRAP